MSEEEIKKYLIKGSIVEINGKEAIILGQHNDRANGYYGVDWKMVNGLGHGYIAYSAVAELYPHWYEDIKTKYREEKLDKLLGKEKKVFFKRWFK